MRLQTTSNGISISDYRAPKAKATKKSMYNQLCAKEAKLALVGLGYVGLPIALEFAKHFNVIGFDINDKKVEMIKNNIDPSGEVQENEFEDRTIVYSSSCSELEEASVYIVAVPTPVSKNKKPNLKPLESACRTVANYISKGDYVIFESTVYPGCTEEVCVPILEEVSGLNLNSDFKVGYSPERINPGDTVNTLTKITKIVSGSDEEAEEEIYNLYNHIIDAGIHLAPSMKVAEASKIIENTQRDVNIALMNELSHLFDNIGINTHDVLSAAGTKWNFLNFYPGLVGGHCIGVDPYYLIHKGNELGLNLSLITESRNTNDQMPQNVVDRLKVNLKKLGKNINESKALVLGATFKENVSDLRNSKAAELCQILNNNVNELHIIDPKADSEEFNKYYELQLSDLISDNYDLVVIAVDHNEFSSINWDFVNSITKDECVVFDFKKMLGNPDCRNTIYLTL